MRLPSLFSAVALTVAVGAVWPAGVRAGDEPAPPWPPRDLRKSYFPFTPVKDAAAWATRREEIRHRLLLAMGLWPMPEKTPLHATIHGRIERDDYTIDKVFFESLPGHFVTGNLYLPKKHEGKLPGVLCPHGHWANGRFMIAGDAEVKRQMDMGAEKFSSAAHSPLQARCVQLARMGCAVFHYDMLGVADSVQFCDEAGKPEHRHGPTEHGFLSADAEERLEGYFGLQSWNSERALDFLLSLPGIDPTRIGCTGASGGGTQTLMITGADDRITASFPCVMTSTAMQGGCTCENADYLRIHQGNIDIAALTAPRPLGMTAADDWTKQLETKGFPDLKNLYTLLGHPDRVEGHFNIKFPHNYNHVSRAQMYAFFNKHFALGLPADVDERDFTLSTPEELTVWDAKHPKPSGDQVGLPHEEAVVRWFAAQDEARNAKLLAPKNEADVAKAREVLGTAWDVMLGCRLPRTGEATWSLGTKDNKGDYLLMRGVTNHKDGDVDGTYLYPKNWNRNVILWLSLKGENSILDKNGEPTAAARQALSEGVAIACPTLAMPGASRNPDVYEPLKAENYEAYAGFEYGYNPTLFAERVRDALAMVAMIRDNKRHPTQQIFIAGVEGAGPIALATTAQARESTSMVTAAAVDLAWFSFTKVSNVWDPRFVPGALKSGDVPALLALCAPVKMAVLGGFSAQVKGDAPPAAAFYKAAKGGLRFMEEKGPPGEKYRKSSAKVDAAAWELANAQIKEQHLQHELNAIDADEKKAAGNAEKTAALQAKGQELVAKLKNAQADEAKARATQDAAWAEGVAPVIEALLKP